MSNSLDAAAIRACRKRLYMTATPRIYLPEISQDHGPAKRVVRRDYSMDDESTYGPELHRASPSTSADFEQELLADYRVL